MSTRFLSRPAQGTSPGGRIAFDDTGTGTPVVCVPGMGDVRSEYRFLGPHLVGAGYRFVAMDLRGHGESEATFTDYERSTAGDDVVALLTELDAGPAHLVGASYGAAAAAWAAAVAPERVRSLTLIGPFVRDVQMPRIQELAFRLLLARPWGRFAWAWWYRRLHPHHPPADLDAHIARLRDLFAEPGRLAALQAMARASSREIDQRLDDIRAPALVVMGDADPDFPDPAAEAHAVAERLGGQVRVVAEAGHYPHAERPEETAAVILDHLRGSDGPR